MRSTGKGFLMEKDFDLAACRNKGRIQCSFAGSVGSLPELLRAQPHWR
jgi:hypothetical protein